MVKSMKLKTFEIGVIAVTAASLVFCAGFYLGRGHGRQVVVNVQPEEAQVFSPSDNEEDDDQAQALDTNDEPAENGSININTASKEELMELPGIGEVLAGRIIEYREMNGPFTYTEEILSVKGIGEKLYDGMEEHIRV